MLILTREIDESIIVGDSIVFSIVEIRGRSIRIGVTAPDEVTIYRAERYQEFTGKAPPATSMEGKGNRTGAARRRRKAGEKGVGE